MAKWICYAEPGEMFNTITEKRNVFYKVPTWAVTFMSDETDKWVARISSTRLSDIDMQGLLWLVRNQEVPEFIKSLLQEEIAIRLKWR